MYKSKSSFLEFNQPMGLHMNPVIRSEAGASKSDHCQNRKKVEYQDSIDSIDRIEVEREFSREKRCYGMGRIVTKLEDTQLTSIALSVFAVNLF